MLHLSEIDAAKLISVLGILSSILLFLCGPLIDRFGVRNCAAFGALLLAAGRLLLGSTSSVYITILCLILGSLGSAIKSGSVVVFLKKHKLSFKFDYVVFNVAFCIAGILFDQLHDYSRIYTVAGLLTIINALVVWLCLPKDTKSEITSKSLLDFKVVKQVLVYNMIMTPVSCIFVFMGNFIPKATLQVLGPTAPIGKLYGSLNPFIILFTVPLFAFLATRFKVDTQKAAILGTALSAGSLFLALLPTTYLVYVIAVIVLFTIGEAIWSPANMELAAKICPTGEEGKYMTLSLIPRVISSTLMSYFISFSFTHFIYVSNPTVKLPFLLLGLFASLSPLLLYFKTQ